MTLSSEDLAGLEARHLAFLDARLVSNQASAEWAENLPRAFAALLATRLGDLADPSLLADAADKALTSDAVERLARPAAAHILALTLRELRAEPGTIAAHVPEAARRKIDALLERPGLLPDRFLREIVEQEAIDEVMRDVLYDGLKEFSEKVNPFTAEWGVPALLKRVGPFGMGIGKSLDSVRAEFDRRLEPEIRKFLQGFSRRGLRRMVEVTIAGADQPKSIALRKHLAAWALEQQLGELARGVDDATVALGQEIALDVAAAELGRETHRARRRALLTEIIEARRDRTVAEALAELGVTLVPDFPSLAAATWPVVRAAVSSPPVREWLASMVREFYAGERAQLG